MQQSMPEPPSQHSVMWYAFWKKLRSLMPPEEYEEYVRYWNSRYGTGSRDFESSNENSSD